MATLPEGINGGFIGKAGSVVGYKMYGKWRIRGLTRPRPKHRKKGTELQQQSRARFNRVQAFLRLILPFIRVGFNLESKLRQNSAHNSAKSYNLLHGLDAEGNICHEKVCVSLGNLPVAGGITVIAEAGNLRFSWNGTDLEPGARRDDQVMLLAVADQGREAFQLLSGAKRYTGTELLEIGEFFRGRTLHTWLSFISDDRQRVSTSVYTGTITF